MSAPVCLIKCLACRRQFPSPIQFATREAFLSSSLVDNEVQCTACSSMTHCNKENMYFNNRTGHIHHGTATIPSA